MGRFLGEWFLLERNFSEAGKKPLLCKISVDIKKEGRCFLWENQKLRKVIRMITSIAAMSMNMHAAKLQQSVEIAMLKDTMEQQEVAMNQLMQMVSNATLGGNIDTYA